MVFGQERGCWIIVRRFLGVRLRYRIVRIIKSWIGPKLTV